jgi:hypothetical protein
VDATCTFSPSQPTAVVSLFLLQKKKGSKAEIAAARNKVSDAKAAVLQLKFDLEQMEAQKDLDKTIGEQSIALRADLNDAA